FSRAMAYEVRRFPKGLRNYAAPFLTNSKHRKKPPSRYFRRRSRNLLLNYIRRQRIMVWLETHIWHAKRFHIIDRWGYRLPDRSFQRNFRPCYRDSVRHCTVRDKSYLSCILISHNNQSELISMLSPLCMNSSSPTFAFKSSLSGRYEVSTLIYRPGQYPRGLIGPARFLWSKEGETYHLALWMHPSCRDEMLDVLKELLELSAEEQSEDDEEEETTSVPHTVEEWRLSRLKVHTNIWSGKHGSQVQDLRDQLVRIRLYGPLSVSIVSDALKLVDDGKAPHFRY
ncbi:Ribonucleases P/MRP protein subunit POP1, partial [Trichostrongylus colubriformis]